jgi:hypothetical protein
MSFFLLITFIFPAVGSPPVRYDGFEFSSPVGWKELPTDRFRNEVVQPLAAKASSSTTWVAHPQTAFQADDSSLCVISFLDPRTGNQLPSDVVTDITGNFERQFQKLGTVDRSESIAAGLKVHQLRVLSETTVVFKTVFQTATGRVAQIDIYVPRAQYAAQRGTLEASIKSLSRDR